MNEATYVDRALDESALWDGEALASLAFLHIPDAILGRRRTLIQADAGRLWAQWFIEGLADPRRYIEGTISYLRIFAEVLEAVDQRFPTYTAIERRKLASSASTALMCVAEMRVRRKSRQPISRSQKSFLIEVAGGTPRCWICGSPFGPLAIDNFVFAERKPIPRPAFIDLLKPRGLADGDLNIQVDHIVPFGRGGEDDIANLALACGWCNRSKSAWMSIYDVEGSPRSAGSNPFGLRSLPQPFWVVRQLGIGGHCEHSEGCDRSPLNSPMTIAPLRRSGALNPINLRVTCLDHDPLREIRLQSAEVVKRLWRREAIDATSP